MCHDNRLQVPDGAGRHWDRVLLRPILISGCLILSACASMYTQPRPAEYVVSSSADDRSDSSLFGSDAQVLSDADIADILEYEYKPPPLSRIALLPFGWSAWAGWSEDMAMATDAVDSQVLSVLRSSARIFDASFLPSILVPEQRSVPFLREAAARYQADLLLVFRSSCQSFERYRLLQADQTRAFCGVEAVLLDVRTGLVPFVATSSQTFDAVQSGSDLNFRETVLRAQLDAIATALGDVSAAVVRFVEQGSDEL